MAAAPKNFTLHFFQGRARTEFVRYVFAAGKVDYVDHRIDFNKEWPKMDKASITPTGVLPVLDFEFAGQTVKLPHAVAMAELVAKLSGLYPECPVTAAKSMACILTVIDFHESTAAKWFEYRHIERRADEAEKWWQEAKANKLPRFAGQFEKMLTDNMFLCGDKLCWADLAVAEIVDRLTLPCNDPGAFDQYPKVKQHWHTVHQLPGLKEYVAKRPDRPF